MKKIVEALLTVCISVLLLNVIISITAQATPIVIAAIVTATYVIATQLFETKGMYSVMGVMIVAVIVFLQVFLTDTYHFLHHIAVVTANERFIFLQAFEQTSRFEGGLFIAFVALLVSALVLKAVQQKSRIGLLLFVVVTIVLQLLLLTNAPIIVNTSFYVAIFIAFIYMTNGFMNRSYLLASGVIISLFMLAVFGLQAANITGTAAKESVQLQLEKWRFNGNASQLPNGQLQYATQHSTNEEAALQIVMEEPIAMYVKGFLGTQLEGSSWQRLAGEQYLQQEPLFIALQKEGFTSAKQFALAATALEPAEEARKMIVQNVGADRRYGYVPYEMTAMDETLHEQEGAAVLAQDWRGAKSYELTYSPTAVQYYPKVANTLYAESDSNYLNMESYYNTFVYENYLHITTDDRSVLANHFTVEEPSTSYEQAIERVQSFLQENVKYKEKTESMTSIQQLLEESKEGYAPHYATLATLLFRSLQIPARYVEGYIVTKEDVENKESYSEMIVPKKNAHAWTEIYIDTIGWIPIEVTPGYDEKMPAVEPDDYPAFDGASSNVQSQQASGVSQTQQVKDEKIEDEKTTPEAVEHELPYWLFILLLIVLVIAVIVYMLYKRRRYLRAASQNDQAIRHWALLLYMLERELQIEPTTVTQSAIGNESLQQAFVQSKKIYEKAKYSGQPISSEELTTVVQTVAATKKAVRKMKKHLYKLPLLWRY